MGVVVLYLKFVGLTPWLLSLLLHVSCLTKSDSGDQLTERGLTAGEEHERFFAELRAEQVEFANVIISNKCDLVDIRNLLPYAQSCTTTLNPLCIKACKA